MEHMLLASFFQIIRSLIDNIPKLMYMLYASLASLLDFLQLLLRKLAGLDTYWVTTDSGNIQQESGDVVRNFIEGIIGIGDTSYSTLSTVFWSFNILGIILLFCSTMIALVRMHFSYDEHIKKGITSPLKIVGIACRSLLTLVAIPITTVFGLWLSEALLQALDTITSGSSSTVESIYDNAAQVFESGYTSAQSVKNSSQLAADRDKAIQEINNNSELSDEEKAAKIAEINLNYKMAGNSYTYFRYDFFKLASYSSNITFSGYLFQSAAYNCNRVRTGDFGVGNIGCSTIFTGNSQQSENILATQVDYAFMGNLKPKDGVDVSMPYTTNPWIGVSTCNFYYKPSTLISDGPFSKFNIYSVWYFYNLWEFNWIVGFAGIVVCFGLMINIIMGLITRIFMMIGLFLISPLFVGIVPLDSGESLKKWRQKFIGNAIMAYGSIVGMNIFFLIFPEIQKIRWFNLSTNINSEGANLPVVGDTGAINMFSKSILDVLVDSLIIIVGLMSIKQFIAVVSELIGAENAEKTGEGMQEEMGKVAGKAGKFMTGAAGIATAGGRAAGRVVGAAGRGALAAKNAAQAGFNKLGSKFQGARAAKLAAKADGEEAAATKANENLATKAAARANARAEASKAARSSNTKNSLAYSNLLKDINDNGGQATSEQSAQLKKYEKIMKSNDKILKRNADKDVSEERKLANRQAANLKAAERRKENDLAKADLAKSEKEFKDSMVKERLTIAKNHGVQSLKNLDKAKDNAITATLGAVGFVGGGIKQMLVDNTKIGNAFIDSWGHNAHDPSKWFEKKPNYEKYAWQESQKQTREMEETRKYITNLANMQAEQNKKIQSLLNRD